MFLFASRKANPFCLSGDFNNTQPSPYKSIQYSLIVRPSFLPQAKGRHAPSRWPLVTLNTCCKKCRGSRVQLYHLFYRGLTRFLQAHANPQPRSGFDALFSLGEGLPSPRHTPWCQFGSSLGVLGHSRPFGAVDRFIWCLVETATALLLSLVSLDPSQGSGIFVSLACLLECIWVFLKIKKFNFYNFIIQF